MTNEEAIFYLKQIREDYKEFIEGIKAIDFAINTLKRDAIVDYNTGYQDGLEDGLNDIRPQGKWIKQEWGYICSVCNESNDYAYDNNIHKFTDNFCPHCGADMRGEKE